MRRLFLIALLLLVTTPSAVRAQQQEPPTRRRVGLALGGGAARGLAHIGVLEWLEENRIPVDYVAGTSIGGLVAGVYASGMSAPELRTYLEGVDWFRTFAGEPPFDVRSFRRKQDRRQYPTALEVGLRDGVQLPGGLDPAHPVGLLISRAVFPAGPITDFDELPIPFRCVAADLRSGDEVVLKSGSLVTALRASMAIPGLFTPIERGNQLLVDGAILNNVPADVVRAMGADVVIAVDVGPPLDPKAKIGSVLSVLLRTVDLVTGVKNQAGIKQADILINPDLAAYTLQDWYQLKPMAERGREAAAALAERLRPLALDEAAWQAHLAARRQRRRPARSFTPGSVTVVGASSQGAARTLRERFQAFVGKPMTPESLEALEAQLTDVTGVGRFAAIAYEPAAAPGGTPTSLRLLVQNKPYGPPFANFVLNLNNQDSGRLSTSVASRVTLLDTGTPGSEVRIDAGLGDDTLLSGEYMIRLAGPRAGAENTVFLAPRGFVQRSFRSLYQGGDRVADYRITQGGVGLDLGVLVGRTDEVRAGFEQSRLKASTLVGDAAPGESSSGSYSALRLRWEHDTQDDPVLPTRGLLLRSEVRRVLRAPTAESAFNRAEVSGTYFMPLGQRDSLLLRAEGGTTFGTTPPTALEFTLGGLLRLGALSLGELRGSQYAYGAVGIIHRLKTGGAPFAPRSAAGIWLETGNISGSRTGERGGAQVNLSGGLLVDTRYLGPVFVGGSIGRGDGGIQIGVGQIFR